MRSRKRWFVGVLVLGLLAAGVILAWPLPARTVTIVVSGTSGTKITGNYEVDGVASQIDSEAPTQFVVTGRDVTCSIHKDDHPGEMSIRIATDDGWASATAGPNHGVRVGYRSGNGLTKAESFWATNLQPKP
jgi:hypothetical protein